MESVSEQTQGSLMRVGELLSRAISEFRENFVKLVGIQFFPALFYLVAVALGWFVNPFLSIPAIILGWLLSILSPLAIIISYKDGFSILDSYKAALKKIVSYSWVILLAGIVPMGGFLMLVIPGIIFSVWFIFSAYVFVYEGRKGFEALFASKSYARGYWWPIAGRFLVMFLAIAGVVTIVGIFSAIFGAGTALISNAIISMLITPFAVLYTILIYRDLVRLKGQPDIEKERKNKGFFIFVSILGILVVLIGGLTGGAGSYMKQAGLMGGDNTQNSYFDPGSFNTERIEDLNFNN